MKPSAYIEISPLLEPHWTGIPAVTAAIVERALADTSVDWRFFYGALKVPASLMAELVVARDGRVARDFIIGHVWGKHDIGYEEGASSRAIFTTMKTSRRLFGEEAILVYDLSPILTPQFHTVENVDHFAGRIRADVATSDHFFCISRATQDDLTYYFKVPPAKTSIVPMGVDLDLHDVSVAQNIAWDNEIEPYVVVLGTLEPRKNGRLVLQYLVKDPGFARRFRIVFIGREGWLNERAQLMADVEAAGVDPERIIFTGFVSEAEKTALLQNCSFCIYASFFEGYGLPILEAATLGKLVVCSNSSSMLEVAPGSCIFFNPASMSEFAQAVSVAEKRAPQLRTPSTLSDVTARLDKCDWGACYKVIETWVKSPMSRVEAA